MSYAVRCLVCASNFFLVATPECFKVLSAASAGKVCLCWIPRSCSGISGKRAWHCDVFLSLLSSIVSNTVLKVFLRRGFCRQRTQFKPSKLESPSHQARPLYTALLLLTSHCQAFGGRMQALQACAVRETPLGHIPLACSRKPSCGRRQCGGVAGMAGICQCQHAQATGGRLCKAALLGHRRKSSMLESLCGRA